MNDQIKVLVTKYADRKYLVMYYRDPVTGKIAETRSTGETEKRLAERKAAVWQDELQTGRYRKPTRITWDDFIDEYEEHVLSAQPQTSAVTYRSTLNKFERLVSPRNLADATTARVTAFATALRKQESGNETETVRRHLRHLHAILNWGHRQGYLVTMPEFDIPRGKKGSKGRAITLEEFERMLVATPKAVGELAADSYRFYLRGLWASGLRLSESLLVRWDDAPEAIVVDLGARRPMLRISAEAEKGNTYRTHPMAPEFAKLLAAVPEDERHGWVFRPLTKLGKPSTRTKGAVGLKVRAIGKTARVKTDERTRNGKVVKTFAGAHDFRRAFGFRWSRKVMPATLKELMRHESIETTMKYYVGVNAEATADELWKAAERESSTLLSTPGDYQEAAERETL